MQNQTIVSLIIKCRLKPFLINIGCNMVFSSLDFGNICIKYTCELNSSPFFSFILCSIGLLLLHRDLECSECVSMSWTADQVLGQFEASGGKSDGVTVGISRVLSFSSKVSLLHREVNFMKCV